MVFLKGRDALRHPDSSEFGTFPTPPSQTGHAPFNASGFPGGRFIFPGLNAASTAPLVLTIRLTLHPFPVSQALPWAVGYYGHSVALRVSPCRRSRSSLHHLVCP